MKKLTVIHLKGFENKVLEAYISIWGTPKLYQNGIECPHKDVEGKRCFLVENDNSEEKIIILNNNFFDPYNPEFITQDGTTTRIYPKLTKFQKAVSYMPFIPFLCFTSFIITVPLFVISLFTIAYSLRNIKSPLNYFVIAIVLLIQYIGWFIQLLPIIVKNFG